MPDVTYLELVGFGPQGWGPRFVSATLLTVEISLGGYAVGLALGLVGLRGKLARSRIARWLADLYTTVVRAVPELLLIVLLYYSGTAVLERGLQSLGLVERLTVSPLAAAIGTLGFVQGAYLTEVFRAAFQDLPRGVIEAGRALALKPHQRVAFIVLPLALRNALPGMSNLWLSILKDSSLISVVGFSELLFTGRQAAASTKHYLFFFLFTALLFLVLAAISNLVIALITRRVYGPAALAAA